MKDIVIVAAKRTAIGKFNGSFAKVGAPKLGAAVIKALLDETKVDPSSISEVIMGQVLTAGVGQNPARQAARAAGIPDEVPSSTLNVVCGSGLRAVGLAAQAIEAGDSEIVIAGGQENMSLTPYILPKLRTGARMGDAVAVDMMVADGLTDVYNNYHMGITAENVAEKYGITREDQDKLALASQNRAEKAQAEGKFKEEIVPFSIPQRKGDPIVFEEDEFIRKGATIDALAKLRPAFKKDGTVTAGNASGINDGAAAVMVMTAEKAKELGLKPMCHIVAHGMAGVAPEIMGIGPVEAVKKVLGKAGWKMEDVELIEANEAFAAQAAGVAKQLNFNMDIVNVNGGAIALGHPIGASGCRILVTLLHEMKRRDVKKGLATLCVGGGMGVAMLVKRD